MGDANVEVALAVTGKPGGVAGTVAVELVASASLQIPGLRLAVDKARFGLALGLGFDAVSHRPALSLAAIIESPKGIGAELGLPGFGGGGYLSFVGSELRGVVTAQLGVVSVTGFGILATEPEFSLLVLLAAEFNPPIQLSFGFTLVGVGGLVGINRRPDNAALSQAVSSGDLSKLLFPSDPVGQADHLLDVLGRCFPGSPGSFVVGPILKLGWGTPTLVSATIGVLVSDQGVLILGRIAITLPFEELAIIRLEALVLGVIDADGLAIDASLSNSNVVGIPVEGDIRLRVRGGSNPEFAFSAGGFHPAFPPPEGMSGMRRIGTEISPGPILRARLDAYMAVTTNSVQFGAHAQLTAGFAGFGVEGHLSFDALIIFDPFGFMVDFSAGVSVECADFSIGSIDFSGHLSGPSPWRINGHASFSILWWDVDVDLPEITWGDANPPPLPAARDPFDVLVKQVATPGNWAATSQAVPDLVQLRPGVSSDVSALHPLATLGFRQSAVPVDLPLARMDGVKLATPVTLRVAPTGADRLRPVEERFVASQFVVLDDAAKLASSGYASFRAGFDVDRGDAAAGQRLASTSVGEDYETLVLKREDNLVLVVLKASLVFAGSRVLAGTHANVEAQRPLFVTLKDPSVAAVAARDDLSAVDVGFAVAAGSAGAALAALAALAAPHPGYVRALVGDYNARGGPGPAVQVVNVWEVT